MPDHLCQETASATHSARLLNDIKECSMSIQAKLFAVRGVLAPKKHGASEDEVARREGETT